MAIIPERIIAIFTMVFSDNQGNFLLSTLSKPKLISYVHERTGIDMENDNDYTELPSCIKKLRYFMTHEPDDIVGPTIVGIIGYKEGEVSCLEASGKSYLYKVQLAELKSYFLSLGNHTAFEPSKRQLGEQVLQELIEAAAVICCDQTYRVTCLENSLNDAIRNLINYRGSFSVKDQTRHGLSLNQHDAGEVDLLLTKADSEVALVEGVKLGSVDSTEINNHIQKLLVNYNPCGLNSYLIAYYTGTRFGSFFENLQDYLNGFQFPVKQESNISKIELQNAAIKVLSVLLSKDGCCFLLYIMAVKLLD